MGAGVPPARAPASGSFSKGGLRWGMHHLRPAGRAVLQQFLGGAGLRSTVRQRAASEAAGSRGARPRAGSTTPAGSAPGRAAFGESKASAVAGESTGSPTRRRWQAPWSIRRPRSREGVPGASASASPGTPTPAAPEPGAADPAESDLVALLQQLVDGRGQGAELLDRVLQLVEDHARVQRTRELG